MIKKRPLLGQEGVTLIELLAALVIFGIIIGGILNFLLDGIRAEERIHKQSLLRDEADIIMTRFIHEIYAKDRDKVANVVTGTLNESQLSIDNNPLGVNDPANITTVGFRASVDGSGRIEAVINGSPLHLPQYNFDGSSILKDIATVEIKIVITNVSSGQSLNVTSTVGLLDLAER